MSKAKPDTTPDVVSGLRVQRDSHQRQATELGAHNRQLRAHQDEIVAWVDDALQRWEAARGTDQAMAVADEIHAHATKILTAARRMAARAAP